MRRSFGFLCLLCLCSFAFSAVAEQWTPQNFPNPVTDVSRCGRGGKPSWICDPDHVLSDYSQNVVEGSIHEIAAAQDPYRSAHCPQSSSAAPGFQVGQGCLCHCGFVVSKWCDHNRVFQVAVALVDKMKLQNRRTAAEQAEVFAKSLHKTWGVGDATCNSGLVLFLSRDDRQVCQNVNKDRLKLVGNARCSVVRSEQPSQSVWLRRCT